MDLLKPCPGTLEKWEKSVLVNPFLVFLLKRPFFLLKFSVLRAGVCSAGPTITPQNRVKDKKVYKPHFSPEFGGFFLGKDRDVQVKPWLPNKVRKPARFCGPLLRFLNDFQ